MQTKRLKCITLSVAALAGASLAGCHDSGNAGPAAPPPNAGNSENFSTLATQLFSQSADSMPFNFDKVTIVYDVNDDPTAFSGLLM